MNSVEYQIVAWVEWRRVKVISNGAAAHAPDVRLHTDLHYEDDEGARTSSHPIRTRTVLTSLGSIPPYGDDQDSSYSETVKIVCCPGGCRSVCCRFDLMKPTSAHVRASV